MADSKTGLRCAAAALAVLALAGCSGKKAVTCQGYVEGEFIYVAAGEAGRPTAGQNLRMEPVATGMEDVFIYLMKQSTAAP